jgi:stage II sporulation protein D
VNTCLRPTTRRVLTTLLAGFSIAPAASAAEVRFKFKGGGFGHGVGMPQYGAYGAARAGWDATRIVGYFYRGAQLATIQPGAVRVLITSGRARAAVSSATAWQIVDELAQPPTALQLAAGASYTVTRDGAGFALSDQNGVVAARVPGQARLQPMNVEGTLTVGARAYRGAMRLVPAGAGADLVNVVDIEQYLWGVVPREMPSKWGDDAAAALQAQAIAARTYAVAGLRPDRPFDLYPDQRSQVYGGVADEDPRTTTAVGATQGQVLIFDGRPITAFFFSSSGGRTEDVRNVFPSDKEMPYLVSVPDPFDRLYSPHHRWKPTPTFTGTRLGSLLGTGAVRSVKVLQRGQSGRVIRLQLTNRRGAVSIRTGAQIRKALGLRDTLFRIARA